MNTIICLTCVAVQKVTCLIIQKLNLKNQQSFYHFLLPENKEFVGQSATMFCLLGLFFINGSGVVKESLLCELQLCQILIHLDIMYNIRKFYTFQFQRFINGFVQNKMIWTQVISKGFLNTGLQGYNSPSVRICSPF